MAGGLDPWLEVWISGWRSRPKAGGLDPWLEVWTPGWRSGSLAGGLDPWLEVWIRGWRSGSWLEVWIRGWRSGSLAGGLDPRLEGSSVVGCLIWCFYCCSDFLITASYDGHVKFWKKQEEGIEFVKHFRAHLERVVDMATSSDGLLMCTISNDKAIKVFDVVNFGESEGVCSMHVA